MDLLDAHSPSLTDSSLTPSSDSVTTYSSPAASSVNTVLSLLQERLSEPVYKRWFDASTVLEESENQFILIVPSDIHQLWIEANYLQDLQSAVHEVCGMDCAIQIKVSTGETMPEKPVSGKEMAEANAQGAEPVHTDAKILKEAKKAQLNTSNTFDRFVVGHSNQFAHAACSAVATENRGGYNPLFIYGDSGLGKTHLMQAVGLSRLTTDPKARVLYLTCEDFINEFIDSVKRGDLEKFRARYRKADVILLDDVQFLAGKERSQEEFFHTFNRLFDNQCQIVLTSDRPASEIKNLSSRLVSRFEAGLTVEMQVPQLETRTAILRRKMDEWKVKLDDNLVNFLAENIKTNVRRLVGGLVRISTYASLGDSNLTVDRVQSLLRDILTEEAAKPVTIDSIQRQVSEHFDIRLADMTSRRRPANIALARQIAMYLSRTMTKSSLKDIGESFGGRDHGTVIHAVKKVTSEIKKDGELRATIEQIQNRLRRD